jgi:hypothetical protein
MITMQRGWLWYSAQTGIPFRNTVDGHGILYNVLYYLGVPEGPPLMVMVPYSVQATLPANLFSRAFSKHDCTLLLFLTSMLCFNLCNL